MGPIIIESYKIEEGSPCFIIAEAGVNHNGDVSRAKKMIDEAKKIGADAIKFQTFKTENLVTVGAKKANYQKKNSEEDNQFVMLKKLELSERDFKELFVYAHEKDIVFLSTPFDIQSADFLHQLGVDAYKIGSGDLTDIPLLRHIAAWGKTMILSTGMSTLNEIEESLKVITQAGPQDIILLHCTSSYPVDTKEVNLRMIPRLKEKYGHLVGFSDHTVSTVIPASAIALGAVVVEKHFTLDRNLPGPDHKMSLEPHEFEEMVKNIRHVEEALGDGVKSITKNESHIREVARKSIVAATDIPNGTLITSEMLGVKRPGTGLAPKYINDLIGLKSRRDIGKDDLIKWKDFR
jgi:N,N'-diacetyllegionaminate synthase